jgi:outer membrane protein assembly factor BamB
MPLQLGPPPEDLPDTPAPLEELGTAPGPEEVSDPAPTTQPDGAATLDSLPEGTQEVFVNAPGEVNDPASWTSFRNGLQLRGIANSTLPAEPELLWEVPTEHGTRSTAAILDGRVYIGTLDGYVLCLDLRNGDEIWKYRSIESTDPEEFAPGFNAPTTVSDEAVFVGDEDGVFHAIDREFGAQLWKFETQGEIVGGATLLPGNRVMFGSHDGRLYCLARDSAEVIWQFETLGPVNGTQAVSTISAASEPAPTTSGEPERYTFVTGCDKPFLRVVDTASGQQVSEIPLGDALLIASPALVNGVLYFGTDSGQVLALDWQQQTTNWIYSDPDDPNQINSSPAVTEDAVIIGSRDRRVHCIERETGQGRWVFETRGWVDGSPVVVGDRVFFGSNDMNLYAVNISDGSEAWQYQVGERIAGSAAVAEGCLVIGTEQRGGRILCFGTK